jgi:hypothetical protein
MIAAAINWTRRGHHEEEVGHCPQYYKNAPTLYPAKCCGSEIYPQTQPFEDGISSK